MKKVFGLIACLCMTSLLGGCGQITAAQISVEAQTYLSALQTGVTALAPVLSTIPGVPPATVTAAQSDLSQASTVLSSLSSTATQAQGESAFQQAETYINSGLNLLSSYSLPAKVQTIVTAAKVAAPLIEAALNAGASLVGAPSPQGLQAIAQLQNAKVILAR